MFADQSECDAKEAPTDECTQRIGEIHATARTIFGREDDTMALSGQYGKVLNMSKRPTRNEAIRHAIYTLKNEGILSYSEFGAVESEERKHRAMGSNFAGATYACPVGVAAGGLVLGHLARIVAAVDGGAYDSANGLEGNAAVSCAYRTWRRATRFAKPGERSSSELCIRAVLTDCGEWLTDGGEPGFRYDKRVNVRDEKSKL